MEFKRQLPGDSAESKRTVFKTVAAFANGYGGNIVFGVEKRRGHRLRPGRYRPVCRAGQAGAARPVDRHPGTGSRSPRSTSMTARLLLLALSRRAPPPLRHHAAREEGQAGRVLRPPRRHDLPGQGGRDQERRPRGGTVDSGRRSMGLLLATAAKACGFVAHRQMSSAVRAGESEWRESGDSNRTRMTSSAVRSPCRCLSCANADSGYRPAIPRE